MTAISRRAFLSTASATAIVAGLPAGASVPVAPIAKAAAAPLPTWIVGTPGEWDHEVVRAATREAAIRFRASDCECDFEDDADADPEAGEGSPDCECEGCISGRAFEATRVPQWDGRPKASIGGGDWVDIGSEAICSRCDYETAREMGGRNVGGKAVCEDCLTLADWDAINPERAAEFRAEMAEDEAKAPGSSVPNHPSHQTNPLGSIKE